MFYFEFGREINKKNFKRNMYYRTDEFKTKLEILKKVSKNTDIYCSAFIFDNISKIDKSNFVAPLIFDIDGDINTIEDFEKLKLSALSLYQYLTNELFIKPNEVQFYFSGSKGFHAIIPYTVLGFKPSNDMPKRVKEFVLYIIKHVEHSEFFDKKIYDSRRLIRLPNSINSKSGLYKIPVTIEEIRSLNIDGIKKLASEQRTLNPLSTAPNDKTIQAIKEKMDKITAINSFTSKPANKRFFCSEKHKLPDCMKQILATRLSEGNRNNITNLIASVLVQHSFSKTSSLEVLLAWNSNNIEPLNEREIVLALNSAFRMARDGKGYGCTAIRESGLIDCSACRTCEVNKIKQQKQQQKRGSFFDGNHGKHHSRVLG